MFLKALILLMCLSTASTLRCHLCVEGISCPNIVDCETIRDFAGSDRCVTTSLNGHVAKACLNREECSRSSSLVCCEGDLCNGATPTGPSAIVLTLASAIFTFFI